jgi:TatD DNase family protein
LNFIIDTHCHLEFLDNLDQVFTNASQNNVKAFINPSVNFASINQIIQIQQKYDDVYLAVGIHPQEVLKKNEAEIEQEINLINQYLEKNRQNIVAIGECGLDFAFNNVEMQNFASIQARQLQLFKQHLDWTGKYDLPIIIHNRKADDEILQIVTEQCSVTTNLKGVFHCFCHSKKIAEQISKLGNFYFGIGGILTLDTGLQKVIQKIPLEKIVLETDSPYIVPKQLKGKVKQNQPANIIYTAQKLAEVKNISLDEIIKTTFQNAKNLFSIN